MNYIIILVIGILSSQDMNTDTSFESSGTTGSVGTVTMNGQVYNQLSLRPEIPIRNLGVGLDIYLYFNDDGMYWESWNFSGFGPAYRTIIDKIYYLKWGKPGDNLYFMAGALSSVTLGHGILVNNYANIMEYPQVRQMGFNLQANVAGIGIEIIHSNFKSATPGVFGLRGSYFIHPKVSIGASIVTDLNQMAGLPDSDGDNYPDYYDFYPTDPAKFDSSSFYRDIYININGSVNGFDNWYSTSGYNNEYNLEDTKKDEISGVAFDATLSVNKNLTFYSQFGMLLGEINDAIYTGEDKDLGWGLVPVGALTQFGPLELQAEYRIGSRSFLFNYWDKSYDLNRVSIFSTNELKTRESQLFKYGKLSGFYVKTNIAVMHLLTIGIGYQNMNGETWNSTDNIYTTGESNQTFLSTIGVNPTLIPKVGKAEAYYQQSNVSNPFAFTPNSSTIWGYNIGVEVSSGVMLVYQLRTTYISDLDNPGEFLPIKSIQIETKFVI